MNQASEAEEQFNQTRTPQAKSIQHLPGQTQIVKPIYDKKTGGIHLPYEKKLMQMSKNGKEVVVEFMHELPRDRMQIRVNDPKNWTVGNTVSIKGKGIIFICTVKSIRNKKVVIQKVDEVSF